MPIGIYDRSGIGNKRTCGICGTSFMVGKTFLYCGTCSFAIQSRNYSLLTERDRKILQSYNYLHGGLSYSRKHLDYYLSYTKTWRKKNPKRKYLQKKGETDRYNNETLMVAESHQQRWTSDEIAYIRESRIDKTAREIAMDLGRTYNAIMVRASTEGIPLMTEDKRHMRLVTR